MPGYAIFLFVNRSVILEGGRSRDPRADPRFELLLASGRQPGLHRYLVSVARLVRRPSPPNVSIEATFVI